MLNQQQIVVVDDDTQILELLESLLIRQGFIVYTASSAQTLKTHLQSDKDLHLILLDVNLPDGDGVSLSKEITAAYPNIPIILMTAQGQEEDHILGLEHGADDYIQKPFNPRTLLARINVVLRRQTKNQPINPAQPITLKPIYTFAHWTLDTKINTLIDADGIQAPLTKRLYDILVIMLSHANRTLDRDLLLQAAEAHGIEPFDRSIDLHVSRLRSILEKTPSKPEIIKTVRGFGYIFSATVIKK